MSASSRKHRGYSAQRLLAQRWVESGIAPFATAIGAGESGNDIVNGPPGIKVEVKAQGERMSLPAGLRQAAAAPGIGIPIVVWRHPGQGPASIGEWTVTMSLADWEAMYLAAGDPRGSADG